MQNAMTMQAALRVLSGAAVPEETVVEKFIRRINLFMSTAAQMEYHRCENEEGQCYQFCIASPTATAEDCRQILKQFQSAGWLEVRVVFQTGTICLTLECEQPHGWVSTYNGAPLCNENAGQAH